MNITKITPYIMGIDRVGEGYKKAKEKRLANRHFTGELISLTELSLRNIASKKTHINMLLNTGIDEFLRLLRNILDYYRPSYPRTINV